MDRERLANFLQTGHGSLEDKCLEVLHEPATFVAENFSHDQIVTGAHQKFLERVINVVSDGKRQRLMETPRVKS